MWLEIEREIHPSQFDFGSPKNYYALNPKLPRETRDNLLGLLRTFSDRFTSHIFLQSSGTSSLGGTPDYSWIALSHEAFLGAAAAVNQAIQSDRTDIWLNPLPLFHVGSNAIFARAALTGAQVFSLEGWGTQSYLEFIEKTGITLSSLVPTQVYDLVRENRLAPKSLRVVFVGGAAISAPLFWKARELGWPLLPTYGMTQTSSQIATGRMEDLSRPLEPQAAVPGLEPLPGIQVKISQEGLIQVSSPGLLTGVLTRNGDRPELPEFHDPKFSWPGEEKKWFGTSDCGDLSASGLRINGRKGEFVKMGGEGVEVQKLNEVLESVRLNLGILADIAVVALPDERLGYLTGLFSDQSLTLEQAEQLKAEFNGRVVAIAKIREWHRMAQVPRTALGKLIPGQCIRFSGRT